jgi:hypothetical protein
LHPAAAIAVTGSLGLALLGDPAAHARLASGWMVAWGLAVLAFARPGPGLVRAALAVRVPLLLCACTLSDDVHRYVWEGRVWAHGFSPFTFPPDAPELAPMRDAAWKLVNHREVSSIYPPAAQLLFRLLAPGGVMAWRLASTAADVGTAVLLARREPRAGWLWALLPLPAVESAVSGHLEGLGVCLLVAALGRRPWAAWLGAMVKLLPAVLLLRRRDPRDPPPWFTHRWWFWLAPTVLAMVPLWDSGLTRGFTTYRDTWAYNGSIFPLVASATGDALARRLLQLAGVALVAAVLWRVRDPGRVALWACGAFVALSPTVHPWYALWPLAAGLWRGFRAWTLLGALIPGAYVVLATYDAQTSTWHESIGTRWAIYAPFYVALGAESWRRWTRAGPG